MTRDEIVAYQAAERQFRETPMGAALAKFVSAHARSWQLDGNENASPKRLREADDAQREAYRVLRVEIDRQSSYIAELEAALEPFKAEAERWPAGLKDRHEPFPISPLKLGDFRRAAAALQKGADHA